MLRPYKTLYVMPFSYTSHINKAPPPDAAGRSSAAQEGLSGVEAKFQFSLKTKVLENLMGDNGDLWLGYTQSSRWQVYNNKEPSRPFRETNYEPEAMLVFRTNYEVLGFKGSMAGIAKPPVQWPRPAAVAQLELGHCPVRRRDWMVFLRLWWRMPENGTADDNLGIENYMGRGEMTVARKWQNQVFSLQARHSLRGGEFARLGASRLVVPDCWRPQGLCPVVYRLWREPDRLQCQADSDRSGLLDG